MLLQKHELYAFAKTQAKEYKNDLQPHLYNHPNPEHHSDLVASMWKIENSEELNGEGKTKLEILQEAK